MVKNEIVLLDPYSNARCPPPGLAKDHTFSGFCFVHPSLRLGVVSKSTDCEFDQIVNKRAKFDIARIRCTFARKSSCIGKYFCIHQNINLPNLGLLENQFPLVTHHGITLGVVILRRFCYSGKQGF